MAYWCYYLIQSLRSHFTPSQDTTHRYLPLSNPLNEPLGYVLALGTQTLMHLTAQHSDAVPADLV